MRPGRLPEGHPLERKARAKLRAPSQPPPPREQAPAATPTARASKPPRRWGLNH